MHMLRELVPRLEVGEIASSLAGNHDLPARTRHLLKHCDLTFDTLPG